MNYLDDVPEGKAFVLGEKNIKNLYGLLFEFREMNDETYNYYAAEDHNYFADWVLHVVEDKNLSDKLRTTKNRKEALDLLEADVEKMRKESDPVKQKVDEIEIKQEIPEESGLETNTFDTNASEMPEDKVATETPVEKKEDPEVIKNYPKEKSDAKIFLWKHYAWEMAKEFMYGLAFGILIGMILAKMFFR